MGTLTTVVNDKYIKLLDKVIKDSQMYSSRSEFLKDAIREKFGELQEFNKDLDLMRKETRKLVMKAVARGWDGRMPTRKKREEALQELLKKEGFK